VPVHIGVIAALLTLMTAAAVLNHAGREVWPEAWLRSAPLKWLITAEHHDLHHKRFACNYGLYFRYWDRLFGTDRPPEEERQASSTAMATASPPPMHREATPLLPPRA
jgi:Delta7-sterol 5-desaturase